MVAMVAGRVVDDGSPSVRTDRVGRVRSTGEVEPTFAASDAGYADSAIGCNMSVRRSVIDEAGPFFAGFIGTEVYNETDFCCRVRALGYRIAFVPEAAVYHLRATRGGCGNRAAVFRPRYSFFHNRMLFVLRALSWKSVPLTIAVSANDAFRDAVRNRQPAFLAVPPLAFAHGVLSWARTGCFRHAVLRRQAASSRRRVGGRAIGPVSD